ncbi:hypothetical protein F5Y18DRAFT_438029 [Xylariaceae sp. FL1019]|nr:hypothetical protein F5Y18DRAFT_438029 [Xylariaceae sp. FL1019]
MSTITTFPQFARLPLELRRMIWGFACRTGIMRLQLVEVNDRQSPTFEIIPEYSRHILEHQRQRMTVLRISREARSEALRYLTVLDGLSVVINLKPKSVFPRGRVTLVSRNRWRIRVFLDWANDVVMPRFRWHHHWRKLETMATFAKLTNLAVHPYDMQICHDKKMEQIFGQPFTTHDFTSGFGKIILHEYPAVKHITLVLKGWFSEHRRLQSILRGTFPPREEKDVFPENWCLDESIKDDEKVYYGEKAHVLAKNERMHGAEVISRSLKDLRPDIEFNVVLDMTRWEKNCLWW